MYSDGRERNLLMMGYPQVALFGGENSKTADLQALATAKAMEQQGASRDDIFNATGFWNDTGRWSYEMPEGVPSVMVPSKSAVPMGKAFPHQELTKAYPSLAKQPVLVEKLTDPEGQAGYNAAKGRMRFSPAWSGKYTYEEVYPHEVQHAIDFAEGWDGEWNAPYDQRRVERRADNASWRDRMMSADEKRRIPPWATEEFAATRFKNPAWWRDEPQNLLMQGY